MEKLLIDIYIILGIYFFLGGIGIILINRKKGDKVEKRNRWVKFWVYFGVVMLTVNLIYYGHYIYLSITLSAIGLFEIFKVNKLRYLNVFLSYLIYFLIISLFIYAFKLGDDVLLVIYLLVLVFDGFSQIFGQLLGKRQLARIISPNKTIEGFFGGLFAVLLTIFMLEKYDFLDIFSITINLTISIFISSIALFGDLLASHFKRINSVKDFSKFIPQHGGILDRFDSFIFTTAIINLIYIIFWR